MSLWIYSLLLVTIGVPIGNFSTGPQSSDFLALHDAINSTDIYAIAEVPTFNATNVIINEVELNPGGSDAGNEWIELYNPDEIEANMSGFEIHTLFKSAGIQLPKDTTIGANETFVIELENQTLSNTAESLILVNGFGQAIDRTPSLVDKNDDDWTWQRSYDSNNKWKFTEATKGELNDPNQKAQPYSYSDSSVECIGTAGCIEGTVRRIVDGDTLYVMANSTLYKVDLALVAVPTSTEDGFIESTSFTRNLCLGSEVLIDQDDKLGSDADIFAVVYCSASNLNSELLEAGYATIIKEQCETSEFADQHWAKSQGC